ncbi:hypothetical protein H072_6175 [Dactylellina haptotyla CBS 200.50]|uniref:AAA+ ATPase domain-containing protein n=1 Tax=Dactylellina haptotyla (strain CBS 200.50) TaxID=1284197 RepID=S8BKV4_DACHA|nr:hypothetical protein H072_6175 [Dactylellina haptotyla CBS 200.50]
MPNRGRKGQSITNLVVDPETLGEDSQDSDFDPKGSHASPSKRQSRTPNKKNRSQSKKSKPRRKRDEYEEDDGEDLSRGSWSSSASSEEYDELEMNAAGRPARRAVKNTKVQYKESSSESDAPGLDSGDEEEEAAFTEDEDVKPKSRKAKAGKTPQKQAPKKAPASTRRNLRRQAFPEEDDEVSVPPTDDEKEEPRKSLIVRLRFNQAKYDEEMNRKGSSSSASNNAPPTQRRSSRLASLPPENNPEDLPVRTRGKSREPTQSPSGRGRRSRSTSRPTTGGKGPSIQSASRPRRVTRAASRASSEGAESVEAHDDMEVEQAAPPAALAMSRITEESTQNSSNKLTNGDSSKDGNFQPGMNSTSTGDSLDVNVPPRELSGLLVAPDLAEDDAAGRKTTRSSVALKKEAIETGIFPEDEEEEDAQVQGDIIDINMDDDDDDDEPIVGRRTRSAAKRQVTPPSEFATPKKQSQRKSKRSSRDTDDEYEEEGEGEDEGDDSESDRPEPQDEDDDYDAVEPRGRRTRGYPPKKRRRSEMSTDPVDLDLEELAEEARDLGKERKRTRREARYQLAPQDDLGSVRRPRRAAEKPVDYRVFRPEENLIIEDDGSPPPTIIGRKNGRKGKNGSSGARPLFNTLGIFGGIGQERSILNSERNLGFNDSDSSDDDIQMMPAGAADAIMPPISTGKRDSISRAGAMGAHGTPMDMGKITPQQKQNLADADPIGIDPNVDFTKVGGLAEHINQLKEMVALPLMYPEIFQNLGITPPRGVLFHGPPGTGKTLLARALANSCSANGKQITFYMRKGADILSKWVGEAERQVRLLFADARKNAPSIIFFDEIDGLAPVRSSKQDQIHASIVSTLLALMDGMDGRGQVIVIGATNRPDSIDPALRRPGRFDREFYFPLPDKISRRSIIDIHTSGWTPPLSDHFKNELASLTKGYGGADLRALCTEAALNAVQRKYPQIYRDTDKKFLIDPKSIEVTARDFMLSVDKIVPSSERSSTSGAAPLPEHIAPLLIPTLDIVKEKLKQVFPEKKKQTALQEAEYEPYTDADGGFGREKMLKDFENTRVFKPRILIHGQQGMGQGYLGAALLHQFEGIHVQTVNLPVLMGDPAKNAEATLIQLFTELRRHKPSVLYIPDLENWFSAVSNDVLTTFMHLVGSIGSSERILLLGMTSAEIEEVNVTVIRDLFGYSRKCRISILKPNESQREQFFQRVISFIRKTPKEFPDPAMRPKRKIEPLPIAPPPPPKAVSKEELRNQKQVDKYFIHQLKVRLMPIIEMLKQKYKQFKRPFIPPQRLEQLNVLPPDEETVLSDIRPEPDVRMVKDEDGVDMILDVTKNKKFYNLDLEVIEERVFNGYYVKPSQFVEDVNYIIIDCQASGERAAILAGSEMRSNVEILIFDMEKEQPSLLAEWHGVWNRAQDRIKKAAEAKENESAGLPAITESGEGSTRVEPSETQVTPAQAPSSGIAKRTFTVGTPGTPFQQQMMQMMPPLIEERDGDSSNGYIASNELGPKDSDGDAVMSDIPAGGANSTQNASVSAAAGSDSNPSSTFKTAAQSLVPQPSLLQGQLQQPQQAQQQSTSVAATQISAIVDSVANTQKSGTGGLRYSSAVGISSTQTQFEHNTMNASSTTSGGKDNSNRLSDQTSSSNRTDVPQDTPPARPYAFMSEASGGSGGSATMRNQQMLTHASTTTGYEHVVAFGDSQLPDTQPVASSEGSAPSQFPFGQDFRSTQATGGYSSGSQQSPLVPLAMRNRIAELAGPGPSPSSSAPPILRRPTTPDPPLQLDEDDLKAFHGHLVEVSQGFTIEQLEQVNAAVMDLVWHHRANWDRNEILREARDVVGEVRDDILEMDRMVKVSRAKWRARGADDGEVSYGEVLTSEVD